MSSIKYFLFYLFSIYAKIIRLYSRWWRSRILAQSIYDLDRSPSKQPSLTLDFKNILSCIDDDGNDLMVIIDDLLQMLQTPLLCTGEWLVSTAGWATGNSSKSLYIHVGYLENNMLVEKVLTVDQVINILPC